MDPRTAEELQHLKIIAAATQMAVGALAEALCKADPKMRAELTAAIDTASQGFGPDSSLSFEVSGAAVQYARRLLRIG